MSDKSENILNYNEKILCLLGRLVFQPDELIEIIMKYKRTPEKYVKAFNLCDGSHTGSQIAESCEIDPGQLSRILSDWNEIGIIYEIDKKGGKYYKQIYKIELKLPKIESDEQESEPLKPS